MAASKIKTPTEKRYFKIRHKVTGLWNNGGTWAAMSDGRRGEFWGPNGKLWVGTGPLRTHITQVLQVKGANIAEWEIIEYKLAEVSTKPAYEMINIFKFLK